MNGENMAKTLTKNEDYEIFTEKCPICGCPLLRTVDVDRKRNPNQISDDFCLNCGKSIDLKKTKRSIISKENYLLESENKKRKLLNKK